MYGFERDRDRKKIMEKSSHATRLGKSDTRQNTQGQERVLM
jgi:hypothetical protein